MRPRPRDLASRVLAPMLALMIALYVGAPLAIADDPAAYEHLWQAETVLGGERGRTSKVVKTSSVTLAGTRDGIEGTVVYEDLLGTEDPSGIHSQSSRLELELTGDVLGADGSAGGTFEGEAVLLTRAATSLQAAVDEAIELRSDGIQAVYEVSGHWGGLLDGSHISGELIFERAELRSSSAPEVVALGPDAFNRLGPTPPGEPQTFAATLVSSSADPVDDRDGGPDATGSDGTGGDAPSRAETASSDTGFWGFVRRGLSGGAKREGMPVPADVARDARALRDAEPSAATPLPASAISIDIDLSGEYLDALNVAAGLVSREGPAGFDELAAAWSAARKAAPGRPATPPDADPVIFAARQLLDALKGQGTAGAPELESSARAISQGQATATVPELRVWTFAAQSVGGEAAGSVLASTRDALRRVESAGIERSGPAWGAVLTAHVAPGAPSSTTEISSFTRVSSEDASAAPSPDSVPGSVIARNGGRPTLSWTAEDARASVSPDRWLAYRRGDGRVYWRAGEGAEVALTDASLRGWAFVIRRAALVSSEHVGRVLARYPSG